MIRLSEPKRVFFPGIDSEDPLELKRDQTKPSWLPRGSVELTVRPVERRRHHEGWRDTGRMIVVEPGHTLNLPLVGEVLEERLPYSTKRYLVSMTLETWSLSAQRIGNTLSGNVTWAENDLGFVAATRPMLVDWQQQTEWTRQLLHIQMKRRGEAYGGSRTEDRQKAGQMMQNGLHDSLGRVNPPAKVMQLDSTKKVLYQQMSRDGISKLANTGRRNLADEVKQHQLRLMNLMVLKGDLNYGVMLKMPVFGVNYLRNQASPTPELIKTVLEFELYFGVLYMDLSAVKGGHLDPADISLPAEHLDFARVPIYDTWSWIVLGRLESLIGDYETMDDRQRTKKITTIQKLIRYRGLESGIDGHEFVAPTLACYLPAV